MNEQVNGCECTITFDISFFTLSKKLQLPIEEIKRLWDNEELTDLLTERFSLLLILQMAAGTPDVEIGGGRVDL